MVKELIVYPDNRIMACGDVRGFDESVGKLFDDIKETMIHHNLAATLFMLKWFLFFEDSRIGKLYILFTFFNNKHIEWMGNLYGTECI